MRFPYDKSSKWLIQHHADAMLRLAGLHDVVEWKALQAELVQPRKLPDGLVEATLSGQQQKDLFLLEIFTYPDGRMPEQVVADQALVFLDRGRLPEVLVLVLHPKGNLASSRALELVSRQGWTRWQAAWRVVELWNMPAEPLLAANDPGLVPWVPLTTFTAPPETIFRQCKEILDQRAKPEEKENLEVVTQVLASLRYNDPGLLDILGGKKAMIESPLIQEIVSEAQLKTAHEDILGVLQTRFKTVPSDIKAALCAILDRKRLRDLLSLAVTCPHLDAFRGALQS